MRSRRMDAEETTSAIADSVRVMKDYVDALTSNYQTQINDLEERLEELESLVEVLRQGVDV